MSDASQLHAANEGEDSRTSTPVETGALEKSSSKWTWQVETTALSSIAGPEESPDNGIWQKSGKTPLPSLAESEKSSGKWVWQEETTAQASVTTPERSSSKWVWQVGTTPLPSVAESEFPWDWPDQPQEVGLEAVPATSQEVTLKLDAQRKALTVKQIAVPPWLLAAGTAIFAAYLVFWNLSDSTLNAGNRAESLGSQLALGAALLAIFAGIVRLIGLQRWPSFHIKKWVLALVMFILLIAGVLVPQAAINLSLDGQQYLSSQDGQQFSVYKQSDVQPYFSLVYPSDWPSSVKVNNRGLTAVLFMNPASNSSGYFVVVRHFLDPQEKVSFQNDLKTYLRPLCDGCSFVPQQTTTQGPWQVIRYREGNQAGLAWMRDINGQRVILIALEDAADMAQDEPVYTAIAESWRPGLNASIPSTGPTPDQERQILSERVLPWTSGVLPFLLGLLALPVLWWRRKRPGTIAACALFFLVLGILQFAYYLPAFIAPHLPQVPLDFSVSSILLTIALGTLLALCWLLIKWHITRENSRLLTLLLALNAMLAFIAIVISVVSQVSLPPGMMAAPLLADSKIWLQVGLLHLGVPLILTAFMLNVTSWWRSRKREKAVWTYGTAVAGIEEG